VKLRPLGYFSWTIWPDFRNTPEPRLPPGILLFPSRLFFEFFATTPKISCCSKSMFFLFIPNQHLRILWIPVRFARSPALPGSSEVFFLVCQSRPAKAPSCDLPTRDRISSKGPRRNMACGKYPAHSATSTFHGSKPGYLRGIPLAVGTLLDCPIIKDFHKEYSIWHSSQLISRLDFLRTVLDRDVVSYPADTSSHSNSCGH
jgi:hypothetical protein